MTHLKNDTNSSVLSFLLFYLDLNTIQPIRTRMSKRPYTETEFDSNEYGFATRAIHAGQEPEKWDSRCVIPPIVLSTTFKQTSPGEYIFDYGRSGNPTRNTLEACLATLENAKYSLTFSSGLGATTTLSYLLEKDQHVLICDDVYGGTNRFFRLCATRMGISSTFVDMTKLDEVTNNLKPNTHVSIDLI